MPLGHARLFAIALLALALAGCSPSAVHFATELGAPDELPAGSPVVHAGARIGKVTSVSPLAWGGSEVGFDVKQSDADLVHRDSIMVLDAHSGSLDLRNPNPGSSVAPPGSRLAGASSEAEANAIEAARGLGNYAMGLAQMLAALGRAPTTPANPSALAPLLQYLFALQQRIALGVYASSPAGRYELRRLASRLDAVRRELERQGKTVQAQQLKAEIDRLRAAASALPAAPPNATVTPRVYH